MPLNIFSFWKSSTKISENEESNCEKDQQQNTPKKVESHMISRGKNNYLHPMNLNISCIIILYVTNLSLFY